jgi:hypothetical protein
MALPTTARRTSERGAEAHAVTRAAACLGAAIACAIPFGCSDEPTTTGPGAATSACAPLDEPGATVTAAGLTTDGHYVVVVSRAGTMRVFYGVAAHLVEGVITSTHQTCALEVDFGVDGRSEVATFSEGPPRCAVPSTLTSGNAGDAIVQVSLTVLVAPDAGDAGNARDAGTSGTATPRSALSFFCR